MIGAALVLGGAGTISASIAIVPGYRPSTKNLMATNQGARQGLATDWLLKRADTSNAIKLASFGMFAGALAWALFF
jgi:hypothetical protein